MVFKRPYYFALWRINQDITDITIKMLTQTLRELETDNLINRKVYDEVPSKVEYTLTEVGQELIPFISYLKDWGDKQIEEGQKITK
ncbi:winged helix-turn-helix transcriptional regulator [Candidatus Kaistella beijingensis]|uniref:winged helix-turn-helix transcriptional regulator n=1 Tax=Candidatus Kaistella beijingensis TaxID=2820270 RepID=UPI00293DA079|nr:winged helix-turn-helix transcriptional regulator [Candidatus Kaistella beijingensis]